MRRQLPSHLREKTVSLAESLAEDGPAGAADATEEDDTLSFVPDSEADEAATPFRPASSALLQPASSGLLAPQPGIMQEPPVKKEKK